MRAEPIYAAGSPIESLPFEYSAIATIAPRPEILPRPAGGAELIQRTVGACPAGFDRATFAVRFEHTSLAIAVDRLVEEVEASADGDVLPTDSEGPPTDVGPRHWHR